MPTPAETAAAAVAIAEEMDAYAPDAFGIPLAVSHAADAAKLAATGDMEGAAKAALAACQVLEGEI